MTGGNMDTNQEYVNMCKKSEEVQKDWKPLRGDFVFDGKKTDIVVWTSGNGIGIYFNDDGDDSIVRERATWLPRQDQLQEICYIIYYEQWKLHNNEDDRRKIIFTMLREFYIYSNNMNNELDSMEQLWLAFVMWKKCGKRWNGRELLWEKK